jgi:hypothetical protein
MAPDRHPLEAAVVRPQAVVHMLQSKALIFVISSSALTGLTM